MNVCTVDFSRFLIASDRVQRTLSRAVPRTITRKQPEMEKRHKGKSSDFVGDAFDVFPPERADTREL